MPGTPLKKTLKWLFYSCIIAAIFFIALQLSFTFYFNDNIAQRLRQELFIKTSGRYDLSMGDLSVNIFTGKLSVSDIRLRYNGAIRKDIPCYQVSATGLVMKEFNIAAFIRKRQLRIGSIEFLEPEVILIRSFRCNTALYDSPDSALMAGSTGKDKRFSSISIGHILIRNANLKVYAHPDDSLPYISSNNNEISIRKLDIDSTLNNSDRLFRAKSVSLSLNRLHFVTADSLYSIDAGRVSASYNDSTMYIDSLSLAPNYSRDEFSDRAGKQTDRLSASAAKAEFRSINLKMLTERNWFLAGELRIKHLHVNAYRDKNTARSDDKPLPIQALMRQIPLHATIQKITLDDAFVTYEEKMGETGHVSFNQLRADITGFNTDTTLMAAGGTLEIKAHCMFMNAGQLYVCYTFPLNRSEMYFRCRGRLLAMPLKAINPMLTAGTGMAVVSGYTDSLIFDFTADERKSTGSMLFAYHDLRLKIADNGKTDIMRGLLFAVADALIIKPDNPAENKPARHTRINYTRNPTRFVFNYSWKSILSGIKPAVGMPEGNRIRIKNPLKIKS